MVFCTDPLFPYLCPSASKCCSLPFYGANLELCYSDISECAKSGQSCESCVIEANNKIALSYVYANWSCGGVAQCEADLGAPEGTAGPFCDATTCMAWGDKFVPGGYSCDSSPNFTPSLGTPTDGICFRIGEF